MATLRMTEVGTDALGGEAVALDRGRARPTHPRPVARILTVEEGTYADLVLLRLEEKGLDVDHEISRAVVALANLLAEEDASAHEVTALHEQALRGLPAEVGPLRRFRLPRS